MLNDAALAVCSKEVVRLCKGQAGHRSPVCCCTVWAQKSRAVCWLFLAMSLWLQ